MLKTVNISVTEEDLKQIDDYCNAHNLARSKFFVQTAVQAIEVSRLANATVLLNQVLRQYQEKGLVDEADAKILDAIEAVMGGSYGKL